MSAGMEVEYLKKCIGTPLAEGCAAAAVAAPSDPVEYLGLWLLQYVKNHSIESDLDEEKKAELEKLAAKLAAEEEAKKQQEEAEKAKWASVEQLENYHFDAYVMFDEAAAAIASNTVASGCYIACLEDPLVPEPDVGDESDVEGPAEGEEEADEGEAAEPEEGDGAGGEGGAGTGPIKYDYRRKILNYVAANKGHEYMLEKSLLRVPKEYGEDEEPEEVEEGAPPPTVNQGVTFDLVDQDLNLLDVPNVMYKDGVHFHNEFPNVGGYLAQAVKMSTNELRMLVCADTLLRGNGCGKPFTPKCKDYVAAVARKVSAALDHVDANRMKIVETGLAKKCIEELELDLNPPP
eukprot:CAMPEP_0118945420 /NCGR_PEP_ID=MMETSP1169-20130426/42217_1 /TAXON_ID=36882 /ORGANISM="Pyramimonas obovata, Strain CCMP722" /LENGTH=347 /DNA_ID=CAMNT_0006891133 /DNA_START=171 /DNA_END=1210 /DNA_ORIENTATION=-